MYAPHPTSSGCRATQSQVHVRTCIWRRFTCMYMICICICTCTWIPQNRCRPATASPQHSAGWQGIAQQFWKQWARGTPVDMDVRVLKSRRRVMSHEICPPDTVRGKVKRKRGGLPGGWQNIAEHFWKQRRGASYEVPSLLHWALASCTRASTAAHDAPDAFRCSTIGVKRALALASAATTPIRKPTVSLFTVRSQKKMRLAHTRWSSGRPWRGRPGGDWGNDHFGPGWTLQGRRRRGRTDTCKHLDKWATTTS